MTEIVFLALVVGVAAAVLGAVSGKPVDRFWVAVVSPAVGVGCLSIGTFAVLLLGIKLTPVSVAISFCFVLSYFAFLEWARPCRFHAAPGRPNTGRGKIPRSVRIVLLVTIVFLAWASHRWVQSWPHGSADAVNIWTSRGQILARADDSIAERFQMMRKSHPDYPLFLPTTLAAQYGAQGTFSINVSIATGILFYLVLIGSTWCVVARFSNSTYGAMAAAIVATNPLTIRWAFTQCADIPLAYFFLLSAGALAALVTRERGPTISPGLTGFYVGLLLWTKNEGIVAALVLGVVTLLFVLGEGIGRSLTFKDLLFLGLGLAPPTVALALFRTYWWRATDAEGFVRQGWLSGMFDSDRWRVIFSTVIDQVLRLGDSNGSAVVVVALAAVAAFAVLQLRGGTPRSAGFLLTAVCGMTGAYLGAYLLSPYEVEWHITKSINRLFLQMTPTLVAGTAIILNSLAAAEVHPDGNPEDRRS